MSLKKYRFKDLIELTNEKNIDNIYGEKDAIGVNMEKVFKPMRGDITEKDFDKFHLVPPRHFAYNPRGGRKLGLGLNDTDKTYIITFNDNVFKIKDSAKNVIIDVYLYIYLCRKEWDRRAEYISWGSSTVVFDWNDFCEEEIILPPIEIQQKYVDIYNALVENQKSYERGLDDLKLVCDAYIENLRRDSSCQEIREYIQEVNNKNSDGEIKEVLGISKQGFIEPKQDIGDIHNYNIFGYDSFVYSPPRINIGSIGLYKLKEQAVCSPIYVVFKVKDIDKLLPDYLIMWLKRDEFFRATDFYSIASVRNNFSYDLMCELKIPIPDIRVQKAIASIYATYVDRKNINEQLKQQIKKICPILIKGSIEEGKKE